MHNNIDIKGNLYKVYGLNVASDFILSELQPGEGSAEVEIIKGRIPQEVTGSLKDGELIYTSKNELYFRIRETGQYYVSGGKRIIVEPDAGASHTSVKLFLLGSAFGAILLQRGILPIHGSAVVIDGQCVILTGLSGAGKSTLSFAFREMGYPFLSDDVSALTQDKNGVYWVQPGYPQQKLCRDSVENMGGSVNGFLQISLERDKYAVPVGREFLTLPVQLSAVCELMSGDCENVSIHELTGVHKMTVLMNHTYRVQLLHYFGLKAEHFKQCSDLAKKIPVYRMIRPKNGFTVAEQIEKILKVLEHQPVNKY